MKCGFIAHPTNSGLKAFARTADLINRVSIDLRCGYSRSAWSKLDCIPLLKTERIQSLNGSTCGLILKYLSLTADEILHHPRETLDRLMRILQQFSRDGAELVGLGGATSIIGDRGLVTAQRSPVKVTSGNSLTTYATVSAIDKALARLDINPNLAPTTIVGFPGTIATALAKILNSRGWPLILVHRRGSNAHFDLQSLMGRKDISNIELNHDIESVYSQSDVFIGATSSGGVIKPEKLQPGSIVFDVALPRDIVSTGDRRDILTLDCGLVSARGGFGLQSDIFSGTPSQQINGCIAETLVLALENRAECLSIGTTLDIEKIMEIGNLANEHGLACIIREPSGAQSCS
jgi:3-acetyloctanal aminotransferase